jgi:hypothetical protein
VTNAFNVNGCNRVGLQRTLAGHNAILSAVLYVHCWFQKRLAGALIILHALGCPVLRTVFFFGLPARCAGSITSNAYAMNYGWALTQ